MERDSEGMHFTTVECEIERTSANSYPLPVWISNWKNKGIRFFFELVVLRVHIISYNVAAVLLRIPTLITWLQSEMKWSKIIVYLELKWWCWRADFKFAQQKTVRQTPRHMKALFGGIIQSPCAPAVVEQSHQGQTQQRHIVQRPASSSRVEKSSKLNNFVFPLNWDCQTFKTAKSVIERVTRPQLFLVARFYFDMLWKRASDFL